MIDGYTRWDLRHISTVLELHIRFHWMRRLSWSKSLFLLCLSEQKISLKSKLLTWRPRLKEVLSRFRKSYLVFSQILHKQNMFWSAYVSYTRVSLNSLTNLPTKYRVIESWLGYTSCCFISWFPYPTNNKIKNKYTAAVSFQENLNRYNCPSYCFNN